VWVASYCIAQNPEKALGEIGQSEAIPSVERDAVRYDLPEGHTAAQVGADLERLGVIASGHQFEGLVKLMGLQDQISAGTFELKTGSSVPEVIQAVLVRETPPEIRITFPEGIRFEEMAVIAEESGLGSRQQFLEAVASAELPAEFAADLPEGADLQGYLFPDTYFMPLDATMDDLVAVMIATLDRRFTPALRAAVRSQGLTLHGALTLAAIVEREAVLDTERPIIANVFLNRLADGIKLDADPTVQFAVALDPVNVLEFGYWKRELTLIDLAIDSQYNTYRYAELPPGPIASPGLASIEAVANPAVTNYYYFVADSVKADGSHVFAETLDQHNINVATVGNQ
jgi:UPF0755 protein